MKTIEELHKENKELHRQLDIRNESTKAWIQSETQTRAYCHKLEWILSIHNISYLDDPIFKSYKSPLIISKD